MRASHSRLSVCTIALMILLAASLSCPGLTKDDWRMYTAPKGDFKLMMPAEVTIDKQDLTKTVKSVNYTALGEDFRACLVACEIKDDKNIFEKFAEGAKGGISNRGGRVTSARDISGPGWSGHIYDYTSKDDEPSALLVAKVDDSPVYYTLAMNASSDSNQAKSMLSSFEVTPSKVTSPEDGFSSKESSSAEGTRKDTNAGSKEEKKGFWYNLGYGTAVGVFVMIGLAFLLVPIGIIALIVYLVKRGDRGK